MWKHLYMCSYRGQRSALGVIPQESSTLFYEKGYPRPDVSWLSHTAWPESPRDLQCLQLPCTGFHTRTLHLASLHGFWRPNSESWACTVSPSQPEPSPCPEIPLRASVIWVWRALSPSFPPLKTSLVWSWIYSLRFKWGWHHSLHLPPSQWKARNPGLTRPFYIPKRSNWFKEPHIPQADRKLSSW